MDVKFKLIKKKDKKTFVKLLGDFYNSPAVDHPVKEEVILNTVKAVFSKDKKVNAIGIYLNKNLIGFGVITCYFATEVGGDTLQLEDIYLIKEYRKHGIGEKYFNYIFKKFKTYKRFRLEVNKTNEIKYFYEKIGFKKINYLQMVKDI